MDNSKVENIQNSHEPFNVYCNAIEIDAGLFDFTLTLMNNTKNQQHVLGRVKMSPEHVKVLANILLEQVKIYEHNFGTIPQAPKQPQTQS